MTLIFFLQNMASKIPFAVLRTGARMPSIGYGTYQAHKGSLQDSVGMALDVGYRHIDTAISYQNEQDIGDSLAQPLRSGQIKRQDLFITTKVPPIYMAEKDVIPCVEESLERLQTSYVDMLLIHTPFGCKNLGDGNFAPLDKNGNRIVEDHDYIKTWKQMEKLVQRGSAKAIGLSNFCANQIDNIMKAAEIPPANLQHECHAYLQQHKLRAYCQKHDIVSTGYSPVGAPTRPDYYIKEEHVSLFEDPVVTEIAEKLQKTPGQVLIRYVSQLGTIPLPKSVTPNRIRDNFESMFFDIPQEDMKKLATLNQNMKYFTFTWAKASANFPIDDF